MRGYRKWSVVVLALVLSFVLALASKLTAEFATIISVCVGAYQIAHAVADRAYAARGDAVPD